MISVRKNSKIFGYGLLALALACLPAGANGGAPGARGALPAQEKATFAAGCFWSMQAIFQQLRGVQAVVPGYAGGSAPNPTYDQVETGTTGYAETVDITFNPRVISYRELLQVLLTVRDPTTRDQQGPDQGPQYRSVIFYRDPAQKLAAQQAIAQVSARHLWPAPIVTQVLPLRGFHPAEGYHWNYYKLHPDQPYCRLVIAPEIARFQDKFRAQLKTSR